MAKNPAAFNKEASAIYQGMSIQEKGELKRQVTSTTDAAKRMTKKEVLKDGEKAFKKIQKLAGQESTQKPFPNGLQGTIFPVITENLFSVVH